MEKAGKARAGRGVTKAYHKGLKAHFGPLHPKDLTDAFVMQYWEKREASPGALREELLELRMALKWAWEQKWIDRPIKISTPGTRPPRELFLSRAQADALLKCAKAHHIYLFILIARVSGHRRGAILGLTWDRVDLTRGFIDFTDPERYIVNKKRTVVPITPEVVAVLKDAKRWAQTEYVIEYKKKPVADVRVGFGAAARAAGIPWATPHLLKHSVISWLAEDHEVDEICDLTATHPNTVRRIYRKINPHRLRTVAEHLSNSLSFRPIGRKPSLRREPVS